MVTIVPPFVWLAKSTVPPWAAMTSRTIVSPRPVPRPTGFVVKSGSNTRLRMSEGMP